MDNSKKLRTISMCHGYGGIELGMEMAGESIAHIAICEIEAFAVDLLVQKMEAGIIDPAPIWTDLKTIPTTPFRGRIDLLVAGYPCQPFSSAGGRKGADDPRHLWPYVIDWVRSVRPTRCFFENVEGHVTLGLSTVISDLEEAGYRATWGIFSASEVGAPHQRKRVFILADSSGVDGRGLPERTKSAQSELAGSSEYELADANSARLEGCEFREWIDSQRWQESNGSATECGTLWPSRPGEPQHDWEPPKTIDGKLNADWVEILQGLPVGWTGTGNRIDRLRLLGNGVVPQTAALAWKTLSERFK